MRGPAASWGLVNKYCAETTAEMYNQQGGVEIGGERYRIEIVSIDDQLDPKLALAGAEQMLGQGIRYIIGPNVDTTAAVIIPLLRSNNAVNIAYGFGRYLYAPPQRHSILGMVASYQASPIIYDYLKKIEGYPQRQLRRATRGGFPQPARRERDRGPAARAGGRLVVLYLRAGHARLRSR